MSIRYIPNVSEIARRYGVCPDIHDDDFIYDHLTYSPPRDPEAAADVYFSMGRDAANVLLALIKNNLPPKPSKISILEFAAGYGRVSRHLRLHDFLEVVPCDIHLKAVEFLTERLNLPAKISSDAPESIDFGRQFDVVFALSFLTHMPRSTWSRWYRKLLSLVNKGGLFIFTTHGFKPWESLGSPDTSEDGFCFFHGSEQKDLSADHYGATITLPHFVMRQIYSDRSADLVYYRPDYWHSWQDTFVVRRKIDEEKSLCDLRNELRKLKSSLSWRLTRPIRSIQARLSQAG